MKRYSKSGAQTQSHLFWRAEQSEHVSENHLSAQHFGHFFGFRRFRAFGFRLGKISESVDSCGVDDRVECSVWEVRPDKLGSGVDDVAECSVGEVRPDELGLVLVGEHNVYCGVSTKGSKNLLSSS
jgi:hypothetical protein